MGYLRPRQLIFPKAHNECSLEMIAECLYETGIELTKQDENTWRCSGINYHIDIEAGRSELFLLIIDPCSRDIYDKGYKRDFTIIYHTLLACCEPSAVYSSAGKSFPLNPNTLEMMPSYRKKGKILNNK